MRITVEAWFHQSDISSVFARLCGALTVQGFKGVDDLAIGQSTWDTVTFDDERVFVASNCRSEDHQVITLCIRSPSEGPDLTATQPFLAFKSIFLDLLSVKGDSALAELLISMRNPEPYPFLTHAFHRTTPLTTLTSEESDHSHVLGKQGYWSSIGPELHFISESVFLRTHTNADEFARSIAADIIKLKNGVLLNCGWTNEFALFLPE